jgi:hypothetical protein
LSADNLHKISFITLLRKATIATDGGYERKCGVYLQLWSLCWSRVILRIWGQEGSVCL